MSRLDWRRWLPTTLAPILAIVLAAALSSLVLLGSGKDPGLAFSAMLDYAFGERTGPASMVDILNKATSYYIAAVAVAIGFRMGLFNIGVDGQYRIATLIAGALGAATFLAWMPGPLKIVLMIVVAGAVGAAWAGIAALLRVFRGVSEVISTIMLNFAAGSLFAYLLTDDFLAERAGEQFRTPLLPADTWMPGIPFPNSSANVFGFILIAVAVGFAYWFLLGRTRFGFDLRASGLNAPAAVASGVDAKRMVITTMLISGGVAGLVGLPGLLGRDHAVTTSVGGLGFTGIAIALLGRNHPVGIALAALLWGFLDRTKIRLDLEDIPQETITIMQGITVLSVVVMGELAARYARRQQQHQVGRATGQAAVVTPRVPPELAAKAVMTPSPAGTSGKQEEQ